MINANSPVPSTDAGVAPSRQQRGLTALYLGIFATAWFSWTEVEPSSAPGRALVVASVVALITAVAGAVVAVRSRTTALPRDRATDRRYGIIVLAEIAVAGLGAAALSGLDRGDLIAPWVCVVVGVHFAPLAPVLRDRGLVPLAIAVTAVAVVALVLGVTTDVSAGSVSGVGAGAVLLGYAALALVKAVRKT